MKYSSLLSYKKIYIFIFVLICIAYSIFSLNKKKIEKKLAGTVCAKLVYNYVGHNFKVDKVFFYSSYGANTSKIDLYINFPNDKKFYSTCILNSKYSGSIIKVKKATLRDSIGNIVIFENLKIDYKQ